MKAIKSITLGLFLLTAIFAATDSAYANSNTVSNNVSVNTSAYRVWVKGHYERNKFGKLVWIPGHWRKF